MQKKSKRNKENAVRMEALIRLREDSDLTRKDFAKSINVSESSYRAWETGYSDPSTNTLCVIADALGTSVDAVLGRVETDTDTAELMRLWRSMEKDARTRLLSAARVEVLLRENDEEEA